MLQSVQRKVRVSRSMTLLSSMGRQNIQSRVANTPHSLRVGFSTARSRRQEQKHTESHATSSSSSSSNVFLFSAAAALIGSGITYYFTKPQTRTTSIDRDWTAPPYGGHAEFFKALPELKAVLSEDRVSIEEEDLKRHGYSEWATVNIDTNPIAIAYPNSTEEVSEIAKICTKYRLPMIGYGGGSSLEGNFSAPNGGICIDFVNMSNIIEIRPDDLDATVQPGVGWMELNQVLSKDEKTKDLFFPVDPGPVAKIGGMVATSCSGTNCVRYGPMRNHVLSMTVVLADGSIIKTRGNGRPRKSSAGYNLNHLFSGSEGTLGLITEITIKLDIIPQKTTVASAPFPTIGDAAAASSAIIRAGVPVHCVELMDPIQMWCINKTGYTPGRVWTEKPTLLFKFSGTERSVKEQIEKAKEICNTCGSSTVGRFEFAKTNEEGQLLWSARKEALWSALALGPKDAKHYATDVCLPISNMPKLVDLTRNDIENSMFPRSSTMGHVGDGNIHAGIIYRGSSEEEYKEVKKLSHNITYRGLEFGGTCTGEHGVGLSKVNYLVDELGPDTVDLMHTIKQTLDPLNLLNPGKIFTKESIERGRELERKGMLGKYKYYKFEKGKPGYFEDEEEEGK